MTDRDYQFIESTISLCPKCLKRVDAKIIEKNNSIYLLKFCKEHGEQLELLEEDSEYYLKRREFDKPGTKCETQTEIKIGCPFDCGLCPSHDQHTCIGLIEVTNACDLKCPLCYANSGKGRDLGIEEIGKMLDLFVNSENGNAEVLQISGGEPTMHSKIIEIIELAKSKGIKYVMLNTNGLRISNDEDFVRELSQFKEGFEIYLQFDGFSKKAGEYFRGKDLSEVKKKAIANLQKYEIPITLVATIEKGINDDEIGNIFEFGLKTDFVRGVNFQPVAFFGRMVNKNTKDRITLTGIIRRIQEQTGGTIRKGDIIPLPCNVERVAISYLYKSGDEFVPLTRHINVKSYVPLIDNTFAFNADEMIKKGKMEIGSAKACCGLMKFVKDLKPIIPLSFANKTKEEKKKYIND